MILIGGNRSTWRKPFLSVTLSTTNVRRTELGSNPTLRGEKIRIIVLKGPVRTARYTPTVQVIRKEQVLLCREMIASCCKNHMEHKNATCRQKVEF